MAKKKPEKIDFSTLTEGKDKQILDVSKIIEDMTPNYNITYSPEKDYWLPITALVITGAIGTGLIFMYNKIAVSLGTFKNVFTHFSSEQISDAYFRFGREILSQVRSVGTYIYLPLIPILAFIIYSHYKKK